MNTGNLEERTGKLAKGLRFLKPLAWPVTGLFDALKDAWTGIKVLKPNEGLEGSVRRLFSSGAKSIMAAAGVALGVPMNILNHELAHSVTAKATGIGVTEISVHDYFGGKIFEFLPGISSGGGNFGGTYLSEPATTLVTYAPQLLAIPGIYMLAKGIQKKNAFLTGFGSTFTLAGIAHACRYSDDMRGIAANMGIDNSALGFFAGLGIVGVTYSAGKKITEYVCKLEEYIGKRVGKLSFTTPALIAAMTGALLFAGQPNAVRSHIPTSKPEQTVASMTKFEKEIVTSVINGKKTLDEALAKQDAQHQKVIANELIAYLLVKEPKKAFQFIRPLHSKKLIYDADIGNFIKTSYLAGADPSEILAEAEMKPGIAKQTMAYLMIENSDEKIKDFAKKNGVHDIAIANLCIDAVLKGKVSLEYAKKAVDNHKNLYDRASSRARMAATAGYNSNQLDFAMKNAEILLSLPNAEPQDFALYANILYKKGEREKAKKFIEEAKVKNPQNAKIYDRLTSHWK